MWMVQMANGWQPADSDAVVHAWIRQGLIGPATPVRHSSWPSPRPLAEVPEFAHLFGAPATASGAVQAQVPRPHPSVSTALVLGIGSLGCVGLSGIPAIIVGRKAIREVAADPSRYSGSVAPARVGIVLGWLGMGLWLLALLSAESTGHSAGAYALITVGALLAVGSGIAWFVPGGKRVFQQVHPAVALGAIVVLSGAGLLATVRTRTFKENCLSRSKHVMDSINHANGTHSPDETIALMTGLSHELANAEDACSKAGEAQLNAALLKTHDDVLAQQTKAEHAKRDYEDAKQAANAAAAAQREQEGDPTCPTGQVRVDAETGKMIRCTGAPEEHRGGCPTLAQYSSIKNGMTRDQVEEILGRGEETVNSEIAGITGAVVQYKCTGLFHFGVAIIQFQNGRVVMKSQQGLE